MVKKSNFLSRRLRQARLAAGLSQKELGKRLRISDKSISAYEQCRALPSFDVLQRISQVTKKPVAFFTEEGMKQESELQIRLKVIENELAELRQVLRGKGLLD